MPQVVVLGSSGYDLTIRLPRLPAPGETLLGGELGTGPGGKGANQAVAARRAGADVLFLTAFGDDEFGRRVAAHDAEEGIDLSYARTISGVANQVALIFVGEDGQNLIGVAPGASALLMPEDIDALPDAAFPRDAVFLASLEVPIATVERGLRRARASGMTTVLNPAPVDPTLIAASMLPLVDILTPNQHEAAVLAGLEVRGAGQAIDAARALQNEHGANAVIVTLGEEGCVVVQADGTASHAPAFLVPVVDTVGAGDAFNGALAVALAEFRPLAEAARWACAAGAFAVTHRGAQGASPTRAEIDQLFFAP